ncbi:MAG: hypothetical protein FK733_15065, partial [Asgard group archaeon]|nr:hypothetical protein [Asgard group archaeon]
MESESQVPPRDLSFGQLFSIYLKTGKKRIILSIISGILVFLTITSLIMVVYTHRYNEFQDYQSDYYNWFLDDTISVSTNFIQSGAPNLENDTFDQIVNEFKSIVDSYIPGIGMDNYTAAISTQVYTFDPTIPGEPWLSHEFMTFENDTYALLNDTIVEGRLPQNRTELLCWKGPFSDININDTVEIFSLTELAVPRTNYTIVGIVERVASAFYNASESVDILNWHFDDIAFYSYPKTNTFFMNYTQFDSIFNWTNLYLGVATYLMDVSWDTSQIQMNKINTYVNNFPDELNRHESEFFDAEILVAPDLFVMLTGYSNIWVFEIIRVLSLNSPMFLLIGLLLVITLTIGSKGLENTYRRMKLYGLSYGITLRMIFFENLMFTLTSFIAGILFGIGTSVLFTYNMPNRPANFYQYFLVEPLLIISLVVFMVGFFLLSFLIQNSIAVLTARTASEEYKRKRSPILNIFSSGEFRVFVVGLLFTVLSLGLYLIYRNVRSMFQVTTSLSYLTMMWFMISCSIAFLMIFFLLLIARVLTLLWTLLGQNLWKRNLNLFSLTLRHLSVNRNNYQLAFVGALIFGMLALPGLTVNQYTSSYLSNEANLQTGSVPILVPHWVDPDNELDSLFTNITEIANFTEVTIFTISNPNEGREYPKAFTVTLIGLEDPRNYTAVVDSE